MLLRHLVASVARERNAVSDHDEQGDLMCLSGREGVAPWETPDLIASFGGVSVMA